MLDGPKPVNLTRSEKGVSDNECLPFGAAEGSEQGKVLNSVVRRSLLDVPRVNLDFLSADVVDDDGGCSVAGVGATAVGEDDEIVVVEVGPGCDLSELLAGALAFHVVKLRWVEVGVVRGDGSRVELLPGTLLVLRCLLLSAGGGFGAEVRAQKVEEGRRRRKKRRGRVG